jgi:hypothetical protein
MVLKDLLDLKDLLVPQEILDLKVFKVFKAHKAT